MTSDFIIDDPAVATSCILNLTIPPPPVPPGKSLVSDVFLAVDTPERKAPGSILLFILWFLNRAFLSAGERYSPVSGFIP